MASLIQIRFLKRLYHQIFGSGFKYLSVPSIALDQTGLKSN
jgi:hypothetical protein